MILCLFQLNFAFFLPAYIFSLVFQAFFSQSDNDDESYNRNKQQLPKSFAISCCKIVSLILLQKLIHNFAVCKHCIRTLLLVGGLSHGFGS